jgi:hypothetical protein
VNNRKFGCTLEVQHSLKAKELHNFMHQFFGHVVAQFFEAQHYMLEGSGFDSQWEIFH